jgi:hypothetical protein
MTVARLAAILAVGVADYEQFIVEDEFGAAEPERRQPYRSRRLRNASFSNRCTSCSFLRSAP